MFSFEILHFFETQASMSGGIPISKCHKLWCHHEKKAKLVVAKKFLRKFKVPFLALKRKRRAGSSFMHDWSRLYTLGRHQHSHIENTLVSAHEKTDMFPRISRRSLSHNAADTTEPYLGLATEWNGICLFMSYEAEIETKLSHLSYKKNFNMLLWS